MDGWRIERRTVVLSASSRRITGGEEGEETQVDMRGVETRIDETGGV